VIHAAVAASALAVRAGLAMLLSSERIRVVAQAASLAELLPLPAEIDVLVVLVEAATAPDLESALPQPGAVAALFLISEDVDIVPRLAGLTLRAWGVLPLDTTAEELQAAVGALAEGLLVGAPALVEREFIDLFAGQGAGGQGLHDRQGEPLSEQGVEPLTEREGQVLQLLAQGLANKQIAVALGISEHTVKFHVSAVYSKLGATSSTEAVRVGVRQGLISL